jgi:DNA ligase (NAD+)
MQAREKKSRIAELESGIRRHQDLYYNGQPEISDADFDALWDELAALDPRNSILAKVGEDSSDRWPKARHVMPMGSQEKASDPEAFLAWCARNPRDEYLVQYKLDGASLELQYESGRLVRAVTRGDGEVGDEITVNAVRMKGVVRELREAFTGGVRGEVLMSHEVHEKKYADKANCRNAANGLMKRKDGVGADDLEVVCYDALGNVPGGGVAGSRKGGAGRTKPGAQADQGDLFAPSGATAPDGESPFQDEAEKIAWLSRMGFTTVDIRVCSSPQEVIDYRAHVMDIRPGLPVDIDGLVVKAREIDAADMARARPEKQIAFKFSLEEAISTLREVEWSETGANYTPIGIIDPVRLAGTTVQRANLVNTNAIRGMGLRIGSRVIMTKRGEIIPKIEGLVENPPGTTSIPVPSTCSCGTALVDEGTRLYCPNPDCPKKAFHRLEKWLSVLDIRDFGSVILGKLFESGRVREIADLYGLEVDELAAFDRMGETLAAKILRNLKARPEVGLATFIAGFDIENVGELIAERAVQAGYDSLERLRAATVDEIDDIKGFDEITARALLDGLAALAPEMDRLLATGAVRIAAPVAGGRLSGKSFCFTGELSMKRADAEKLVKSLGGTVKSSVTKDLSFLVTNDPGSGSDKNRKAAEYGVGILDEAAFLELAGQP